MIPCAYLRVFRPLDTYPEAERAGWERYILSGGPPRSARPVYRHASPGRDSAVGLLAPAEGEHADIRVVDGRYHVCPWRTRLRILAGIVSLRETVASDLAEVFVPEEEARRAARELARLRRREPSAAPPILQSPWHVPVRWFVLVDDPERRLVQDPSGDWRLLYWTPLPEARRRADRAVKALRRSELAPLAGPVRELAEWLAAFHPASAVELDYGSVSSLFSWDELDNDHSGRDIQLAVGALERPGGMAEAAERYQSVVSRWVEARSRESMN